MFADTFCIGADFKFFHDRYKEDPEQFWHVDDIVSVFDTNGMSSTKMITLYIEQSVVNGFIKNENFERALAGITISYYMKKTFKKILPAFIYRAYLRKKLRNSLYE